MIGFQAQCLFSDSLDRAIAIGYEADVRCHSCTVIGGTGVNAVNVGIGTLTPTQSLDVVGNTKILGRLELGTSTDNEVFIGVGAGMNKTGPAVAYFALKGFDVATSSWRNGTVAKEQLKLLESLKDNANPITAKHIKGMVHTCWSSTSSFMDRFYIPIDTTTLDDAACFRMLFGE